jgi:hypothetical protein
MAFESGSLSFRIFALPQPLTEQSIERFAEHAVPPLHFTITENTHQGWVTGRHLLDRNINADSAMISGCLRLTLMKAERKIPPALLRAECKMEELAEMQAKGTNYLRRNERSAIKKQVIERLLPEMPPVLTGIDWTALPDSQYLYATAMTDKQLDAFALHFRNATGMHPETLTPETLAVMIAGKDCRDLAPVSFSPEMDDHAAELRIGRDFLTWLWFFAEACGGCIETDDGAATVLVEGPLIFAFEGEGAHETVLRKGQPTISAEAKTSLLAGKKLKSAKVTIALHDQEWKFTLDADTFAFRSVSLPKGEEVIGPEERFLDRFHAIERLRNTITAFYKRFLDERTDEQEWLAVRKTIHQWVQDRRTRT